MTHESSGPDKRQVSLAADIPLIAAAICTNGCRTGNETGEGVVGGAGRRRLTTTATLLYGLLTNQWRTMGGTTGVALQLRSYRVAHER